MNEPSSTDPRPDDMADESGMDEELKAWFAELHERERQEREARALSVTKTVRFSKRDWDVVERRAEVLGIREVEYIRLMCTDKRPDVVVFDQMLTKLCDLVSRFSGAFQDLREGEVSEENIGRLRILAEEMNRQAGEICGGYAPS